MNGICEMCGEWHPLDTHEIFPGSNRQNSKKYNMTIQVCRKCHTGSRDCIQYNAEVSLKYKRKYQAIFEETHTRAEFVQIFGKNYLD